MSYTMLQEHVSPTCYWSMFLACLDNMLQEHVLSQTCSWSMICNLYFLTMFYNISRYILEHVLKLKIFISQSCSCTIQCSTTCSCTIWYCIIISGQNLTKAAPVTAVAVIHKLDRRSQSVDNLCPMVNEPFLSVLLKGALYVLHLPQIIGLTGEGFLNWIKEHILYYLCLLKKTVMWALIYT